MQHTITGISNLKHILAVLAVFILAIGSVSAQSVQDGIVYEYNGENSKKPLANVEIQVNNAGSTVSDKNGRFTLNFRTLKPGDKITVRRVEKLGYEVMNPDLIAQFVITRNNDPITIVMCKSEYIKGTRDKYTNLARNRYAAQMEQEEKELKANVAKGYMSMKEYERRVNEIKMKYEEQLENIENYIERFSRIDLTEISEVDRQVIDLINAGEIDEAIRKYDEQNLINTYRSEINDFKSLTEAETRIAQAAEEKKRELANIKTTIQRHIDLLYLAGGKENFNKIISLLHDIADANPNDLDAQLQFADMQMMIEDPQEAMKYYNKAFVAANGDITEEAKVQVKRGAAFFKMNNLSLSFSESMTALRNLDSVNLIYSDSDMYLSERANAQKNIASIYSRQQKHDEALRYLDDAIQIYEVLVELDSVRNIQGYADIMMQYGKELISLNDTINAEQQMKTAIKMYENLQTASPQKNSATLAAAYTWLGDLYRLQRKFELSEEYLIKASNLYDYARNIYPDLYLNNYAECIQILGKLYIWKGDYNEALKNLDIADKTYSKLAEKNPDMYTDKIGEIHLNKGTVYWFTQEYEKAAVQDSIAVKRYEELYKITGSAFNRELAQGLNYLGDCYFKLGDYAGANHCYTRAAKYFIDETYVNRVKQARQLATSKTAPKVTPELAPKVKPSSTPTPTNKKKKNS